MGNIFLSACKCCFILSKHRLVKIDSALLPIQQPRATLHTCQTPKFRLQKGSVKHQVADDGSLLAVRNGLLCATTWRKTEGSIEQRLPIGLSQSQSGAIAMPIY